MIPQGTCLDHDAVCAQWLSQRLEMFLVILNNLVARFFQRRRIEQPIATQVLIVVAHEQLELGTALLASQAARRTAG